MKADRYVSVLELDPEVGLEIEVDPTDGYYCRDCGDAMVIPLEELEDHDRLHVERAASLDPDQGALL